MNAHVTPDGGLLPAARPTLVLGGDSNLLGSVRHALAVATLGSFYAIDLDLRHAWRAPSCAQILPVAERETIRIRSVWLPDIMRGPLLAQRSQRLEDFLQQSRDHHGLRQLIVPRLHQQEEGYNVSRLARDLTKHTGGVVRLAIGVQAASCVRQADYLDRITAIRRAVEEWDMDIALDLTGNVSPRWESEAAVAKMFRRLALVRIDPWLDEDGMPDMSPRAQLAVRTLSMLADQRYTGIISLYPFTRSILAGGTAASVAAYGNMLYENATARFAQTGLSAPIVSPTEIHHPSPDRP